MTSFTPRRIDTVVIGGGQAGLSVGYHLMKRGRPFVILDAAHRTGDAWRNRWDSLRLFTPAKFNGLDGLDFPSDPNHFPTKDEMADYLETYARTFDLPIEHDTEVDRLSARDGTYVVASGDDLWEAENVVIAMSHEQVGLRPDFADDLDAGITQIHSIDYRNPGQLQDGRVLVVGAANSGVEIALDLAATHEVLVAGNHPGAIPFDIEGFMGRTILVRLVLRGVFHRLFSLRNPIGRKAGVKLTSMGKPLVRSKPSDLRAAGVTTLPRIDGVDHGMPVTTDGRRVDVANVIWATGYRPGFDWIDIDLGGDSPRHDLGVVEEAPGLYFVGLDFLSAASSSQIHGVGRDAGRIAREIDRRTPVATPQPA